MSSLQATNGRPWTPEEERRLKELWEEGLPVAEIAQRLDRSAASLYVRRQSLRLPNRPPGGLRPAKATPPTALVPSRSPAVQTELRPWTAEEDERLRQLWPVAVLTTIADAFPDRSRYAIRKRAHRLGVTRLVGRPGRRPALTPAAPQAAPEPVPAPRPVPAPPAPAAPGDPLDVLAQAVESARALVIEARAEVEQARAERDAAVKDAARVRALVAQLRSDARALWEVIGPAQPAVQVVEVPTPALALPPVAGGEAARLRAEVERLQVMLAVERKLVWRPRGARWLGLSEEAYLSAVDRQAAAGAERVEAARRERSGA